MWKHQFETCDPNLISKTLLTVLWKYFLRLVALYDIVTISDEAVHKMHVHMLTQPTLLLQPPSLSIFTPKQWPKLPPPSTHTLSLLFKKQQTASFHADVSHHLYFLISIFFFLSGSSQLTLPLYPPQNPFHKAPQAFLQLHFFPTAISFLSDSPSAPPLWDILGQGSLKHITLPPSLLPHLPPSLSSSE